MSTRQMSSGGSPRGERPSAPTTWWSFGGCWIGWAAAWRRAMRKAYYAACVNAISPCHSDRRGHMSRSIAARSTYGDETAVDSLDIAAYLYLRLSHGARHGQGKAAGSEEPSAGPWRRAQPSPRRRLRFALRQQPVLRPQGPDPGTLRDGASPPGRRRLDHRRRRGLRRLPADLLQSTEHPGGGRARRSDAEPAWSQGRPQGLRRGRRLRHRPQGRKAGADDVGMSARRRGPLRRQGASAQPRTRADAQKKTIRSDLILAPATTVDAYERLRAAVLRAEPA